MTKEEYVEKKDLIARHIESLNNQGDELDAEYIESNKRFDIGEKVISQELKRNCPIGTMFYVGGYEIWQNEVQPLLFKSKKDGSMSKNNSWFYSQPRLKKAE